MSRLTLRLLGGVSIQRGDRPLTGLPSRKAEALLIYLSCTQRPAAREVLADLLWDDRPPRQALANLRTLLTGLRRALGKALVIDRDSISFNPEADYWLDVKAFEQHIADVKWQMADSRSPKADPSTSVSAISLPSAIGHLRSANDLYRGDFLAGFHLRQSRGFEEWATLERERLHRLAVLGLRRLVQHSLDRGDYAPGLDLAARLLQLDPLGEEAHRAMMLLLARSGQRTAALAQYEACRRRLAEELDVTPTDETAALYARIRSAGASGAHNLPPPATEFVGREAELGALTEELARPACRLITLLGPGGIGKTRRGVETARQIGEQRPGMFLHGVRFVPLAGLHSAQFLAAALADALDEPEAGDPRERLLNYLSEREMLLLLDNMEPDIIDLNMGCYVKDIAERGAGSGMLREPDKIARVFGRLSRRLSLPITGKIRLGWDDASRNHVAIARILEDNGASLIAVHGRTKAQAYKGEADWGAIAEVKQAVKIPVIGNGDVRAVADIARLRAHTGCDGVMIGRAAIGNPWIFAGQDREQVTFEEKLALMRRHLALNLDFYGPGAGLVLFRKHAAKYIQGLPGEDKLRLPLLTCQTVEEFDRLIEGPQKSVSLGPRLAPPSRPLPSLDSPRQLR
jgi:nifR3 family TIM-barrel protein